MKSFKVIWIFLPPPVRVLSACSPLRTKENLVNEESQNSPAEIIATDEVQAEPTTEEDHQSLECEDPFSGTFPVFSTAGWETNFCKHNVPFDEIFSGGPSRDGIPPLDSPRFESVESADIWIEDVEPVILFELDGTARAYPLQIMTWHEIVNDQVAGTPVVVTFCPLCNTALVFQRPTIDGETLTFGTSGNLRYSDLVMWDRQTESWWQQFTGEAIVGDLTGTRLEFLPAAIISWADFRTAYPDGEVLSIDTGFRRDYGRNPYSGYDNINSYPFAYTGDLDNDLPAMARVLGIELEDGSGGAFSLDQIRELTVLNETLDETPIVIFWKSGTASALDSSSISNGRDVGTTGVFLREVNGQILTFNSIDSSVFVDQETGSSWNILGQAFTGPLEGTTLVSLPHHDTFWFAWAAFVPGAEIRDK